jgi:steroid 5-alpha reductase family enzyme
MNKDEIRAWIAVPVIVVIGAGLALAGSQGSAKVGEFPLYALGITMAFVIQWVAFIPSFISKTEHYYDLTGSITYNSVIIVSLLLSPKLDARALMLGAMVIIWAVRLGTFLFKRVRKAGADERFDEIKMSFPRFLMAWTLQGLWVSFSLAAALAAITSTLRVPFGTFAVIGLLVWLFGFGTEVIADWQKSRFRSDPANKGKFIHTGLWSWSRHPNYFGEIVLWIGVAIAAAPVLRGWQWAAMISPVFITLLLTRISGVPLLEKRSDEKWGGQEDYEAYKELTSVLIPLPPRKS